MGVAINMFSNLSPVFRVTIKKLCSLIVLAGRREFEPQWRVARWPEKGLTGRAFKGEPAPSCMVLGGKSLDASSMMVGQSRRILRVFLRALGQSSSLILVGSALSAITWCMVCKSHELHVLGSRFRAHTVGPWFGLQSRCDGIPKLRTERQFLKKQNMHGHDLRLFHLC